MPATDAAEPRQILCMLHMILSPALDRVMRPRDAALVIAVSAIVTAVGTLIGELVRGLVSWQYIAEPSSFDLFGIHTLTAWLIGLGLGIGASVLLSSGRPARAFGTVLGLVCLALFVTTLALPSPGGVPFANLVVFAAGLAAAFVIYRRARSRPALGMRITAIAATLACAIAFGVPTLRETHEEYRSQALRTFTIELVAAYPAPDLEQAGMPAYVLDRNGGPGELVEHAGQRVYLHRTDRVVIHASQVRRVRWIETDGTAWVCIRYDDATAKAIASRSERRMSQLDALFVNGELVSIPVYRSVMGERLCIDNTDREALRRLYGLLAP